MPRKTRKGRIMGTARLPEVQRSREYQVYDEHPEPHRYSLPALLTPRQARIITFFSAIVVVATALEMAPSSRIGENTVPLRRNQTNSKKAPQLVNSTQLQNHPSSVENTHKDSNFHHVASSATPPSTHTQTESRSKKYTTKRAAKPAIPLDGVAAKSKSAQTKDSVAVQPKSIRAKKGRGPVKLEGKEKRLINPTAIQNGVPPFTSPAVDPISNHHNAAHTGWMDWMFGAEPVQAGIGDSELPITCSTDAADTGSPLTSEQATALPGSIPGGFFGSALATYENVLAVGSYLANEVFIYNLDNLNNSFVLNNFTAGSGAGFSIAMGNLNGGKPDVVVSAPLTKPPLFASVYVYYDVDVSMGTYSGLQILSDPQNATNSSTLYGFSVYTANNFSGNGFDSVFIGSPWANNYNGLINIWHGGVQGIGDEPDVTINNDVFSRAQLGSSLNALDFDNDGQLDVVSGMPYADGPNGAVCVVYNSTELQGSVNINDVPSLLIYDNDLIGFFGEQYGSSLAVIYINGVVCIASGAPQSNTGAGRVIVVCSPGHSMTGLVNITDLGSLVTSIYGLYPSENYQSGGLLGCALGVTSRNELIMSACNENELGGRVYMVKEEGISNSLNLNNLGDLGRILTDWTVKDTSAGISGATFGSAIATSSRASGTDNNNIIFIGAPNATRPNMTDTFVGAVYEVFVDALCNVSAPSPSPSPTSSLESTGKAIWPEKGIKETAQNYLHQVAQYPCGFWNKAYEVASNLFQLPGVAAGDVVVSEEQNNLVLPENPKKLQDAVGINHSAMSAGVPGLKFFKPEAKPAFSEATGRPRHYLAP